MLLLLARFCNWGSAKSCSYIFINKTLIKLSFTLSDFISYWFKGSSLTSDFNAILLQLNFSDLFWLYMGPTMHDSNSVLNAYGFSFLLAINSRVYEALAHLAPLSKSISYVAIGINFRYYPVQIAPPFYLRNCCYFATVHSEVLLCVSIR